MSTAAQHPYMVYCPAPAGWEPVSYVWAANAEAARAEFRRVWASSPKVNNFVVERLVDSRLLRATLQ